MTAMSAAAIKTPTVMATAIVVSLLAMMTGA
jgi:hypothetical protein